MVLTTLPLAVRRRYPLAAFWMVVLAALVSHEDATWITVLACAVAAYGALAYSRHRVAAAGGIVLAAVLTGVIFQDVVPALPPWAGPVVVLFGAGALAGSVRFWQGRLKAGRDRISALQRAQDDAMRGAVEEERARIAAELHDIVTHNVSVMVIQAGAARKVMDAEPGESKRAAGQPCPNSVTSWGCWLPLPAGRRTSGRRRTNPNAGRRTARDRGPPPNPCQGAPLRQSQNPEPS
jgi:signal transduction histidine kinase